MIIYGTPNPPVLDYNLPAGTCFDWLTMIPLAPIGEGVFKPEYYVKPPNNVWEILQNLTMEEILNEVLQVLSGIPGQYGIFVNEYLLHGNPVYITTSTPQISNNQGPSSSGSGGTEPIAIKKRVMAGAKQQAVKKDEEVAIKKDDVMAGYLPADPSMASPEDIAQYIEQGLIPVVTQDLYGNISLTYIKEPESPIPQLYIVEHFKTCSYLKNYGAGKTLRVFSLLPGEKTKITIRTYKKNEEVRTRAENILDSFSQSSAHTLENLVESETNKENSTEDLKSRTNSFNVGYKVDAQIPVTDSISLGVNAGQDSQNKWTKSHSEIRTETVRSLSHALDKHVAESNSSRQVDINDTTTVTSITEEEITTTREIENINFSRVLNFVFRQLNQEYLTLTWLDSVSFAFTNGYPETQIKSGLGGLYDLLTAICATTASADEWFKRIMLELCNVRDYTGMPHQFAECLTQTLNPCCGEDITSVTQKIVRKKWGLKTQYEGISVPGLIIDAQTRILHTDSVVCDSLLGQGEALDCFNMRTQEAAAQKAEIQADALRIDNQAKILENQRIQQAMDILNLISDPVQRAELYKKIFTNCCNTPQSGCNCCNGSATHTGGNGSTTYNSNTPTE